MILVTPKDWKIRIAAYVQFRQLGVGAQIHLREEIIFTLQHLQLCKGSDTLQGGDVAGSAADTRHRGDLCVGEPAALVGIDIAECIMSSTLDDENSIDVWIDNS